MYSSLREHRGFHRQETFSGKYLRALLYGMDRSSVPGEGAAGGPASSPQFCAVPQSTQLSLLCPEHRWVGQGGEVGPHVHAQGNQSLCAARGRRGEVSSPLSVYGDSFPKTSSTVVILCSAEEDDRQSVLWWCHQWERALSLDRGYDFPKHLRDSFPLQPYDNLRRCFPFSFLVPSAIFSDLKQEHPPHLKHRVPHVHSHHRGASQILTGSGGQKAVGSNLGSQI